MQENVRVHLFVAEVLVGLATDTPVVLSRREAALKLNKLTFIICASDSSWHPGLLGRPLFPRREGERVVAMQKNVRVHLWTVCRANKAHIRQSRPDSGLGFQINVHGYAQLREARGHHQSRRCRFRAKKDQLQWV